VAQVNLGVLYAGGAEGAPQDEKEAVRWFRLAAEQKNASAQFNLGVMYYTGEGVPQNIEEAARWFRQAAEQGKAVAQYNLGALYGNGLGVPKDCVQALMWLILAAAQDNKEAVDARESFPLQMTSSQIEEANRLACEWKPKK
jgi:TPR repeat protein